MKSNEIKPVMQVLEGERVFPPPIWMMRQAGRYLPEYRRIRSEQENFLSFCLDVDLAFEATLQPIQKFGFDAAILFSDIFVLPNAMGYSVKFEESMGPKLCPLSKEILNSLDTKLVWKELEPVFEIISKLKSAISDQTALIGFCGAPWTINCYTIAGFSTPEQMVARVRSYENPELVEEFFEKLISVSIEYLLRQLHAGADAVQIFDTWAGILDEKGFEDFVIGPTKKIVAGVKEKNSKAKIIGFPRGNPSMLKRYVDGTGVDAVGIDWTVPFSTARELQVNGIPVQGNLDPMRLKAGGSTLDNAIDRILVELGDGPLIFNLGHGIDPETSTDNVERMVKRVKSAKK